MNKTAKNSTKGTVLLLFAISLVAVVSMMALAVDLSNAYLNKTRLQNLVDALALSAAVSLDASSGDTDTSISGAETTFDEFVAGLGNTPLENKIDFDDIVFEFSTLWAGPYSASNTSANFVRVAIGSFPSTIFFGSILNVDSLNITASAVAGPLPVDPCNLLPIAACAGYTESGELEPCNENTDGTETACFGLPYYNQSAGTITHKQSANDEYDQDLRDAADVSEEDDITYDEDEFIYTPTPICNNASLDGDGNIEGEQEDFCSLNLKGIGGGTSEIGPGNFNLLSLSGDTSITDKNNTSASANDLRKNFAGGYDKCETINSTGLIDTKPGSATGPVLQGINTRFGIWQTAALNSTDHPKDVITAPTTGGDVFGSCGSAGYCEYQSEYEGENDPESDPGFHRRLAGIPVINCTGLENGAGEVEVLGVTCIFLTEKINNGNKEIHAEILPPENCPLKGIPSGTSNTGITNLYLYKDPKNKKES